MNRISDENFKEFYPKVEESLRNSSFIAIDAEFSGLTIATGEDCVNQSLFDSPSERYSKLKDDIEPFVAVQFGLTTFTRAKHDDKYNAECFHFHLLPRALPTANRAFVFQAAAVQFLSSHNFDFNQFAYNGISYLDEAEEVKLRQSLRDSTPLWCASEFIPLEGQDEVDDVFKRVQKWLSDATGTEKVLQITTSSFPVQYLMQKELRQSFKGIWTESQGKRTFSVIKVTADVREQLEKQENEKSLDNDLLDYYMGFSKIFKLMKNLKKPIVGHNLLLDLMFIHKQFFRPLPKRYESFKSSINQLFPLVYDTKFLSYELKSVVHTTTWKSNGLAELYSYFKDGPGRHVVLNSPAIGSPGGSVVPEDEKFHDAGWDSYCTGYCFIRMAHIYTVKKLGTDADMRRFTNAEIMSGVRDHANRVNLIRADLSHLRLDSLDPPSTRPRWLHVRTIANNTSTRQIAQAFSRFGPVDVKRYSARCLLVAVPNHGAARDILKFYEKHSELQVVPYDSWRHSPKRVNVLIWAGSLLLSGAGVVAWLLRRNSLPSEPLGR